MKRWLLTLLLLLTGVGVEAQLTPANHKHVVVVSFENRSFEGNELGSTGIVDYSLAPYFNTLANTYGLATNFYANGHDSLKQYFWVTDGTEFCIPHGNDPTVACGGDPQTYAATAPNIFELSWNAGLSWKQYIECAPNNTTGTQAGRGYITQGNPVTGCAVSGNYIPRHAPAIYFNFVRQGTAPMSNMDCSGITASYTSTQSKQGCNVVRYEDSTYGFQADITNKTLPNYSFITPSGENDMHNGSRAAADTWLSANIGPLLNSCYMTGNGCPADLLLIIWFDEGTLGSSYTGTCSPSGDDRDTFTTCNGGGRIPVIIVAPDVKPGFKGATYYRHPSALKLTLKALGLTTSSTANTGATTPDMSEFLTGLPSTLSPIGNWPRESTTCLKGSANWSGVVDGNIQSSRGFCLDGKYGQTNENTAASSWQQGVTSFCGVTTPTQPFRTNCIMWDGCVSSTLHCRVDTFGIWAVDIVNGVKTGSNILVAPRPLQVASEELDGPRAGVRALLGSWFTPDKEAGGHMTAWFCATSKASGRCGGHLFLGFNSRDVAQADETLHDLKGRGHNWWIADWNGKPYGTSSTSCAPYLGGRNCTTDAGARALQARNSMWGFTFQLQYDSNAWDDCEAAIAKATNPPTITYADLNAECGGPTACSTVTDGIYPDARFGSPAPEKCTLEDKATLDIRYATSQYFSDVRYYKNPATGKPLVSVFGGWSKVNWTTVRNDSQTDDFDIVGDFRDGRNPFSSTTAQGGWTWFGKPPTQCGYTQEFASSAWCSVSSHKCIGETTPCSDIPAESCSTFGTQMPKCSYEKGILSTKHSNISYWKSFDNRPTPWSQANGTCTNCASVKIIPTRCGKSMLEAFAAANTMWAGAAKKPDAITGNTWQDYDESSQIETGIEGCWTLTNVAVTNGSLKWSIQALDPDGTTGIMTSADATTASIAFFRIFCSGACTNPADPTGEKLAWVADVDVDPNTTVRDYSFPVTTLKLNQGTHIFYVKLVSKANIYNKMSQQASFTLSGNQNPNCVVNVTPQVGTVSFSATADASGSSDPDGTISTTKFSWGDGTSDTTVTWPGTTSAAHSYTTAGQYFITSTCTDNGGATDTDTDTVQANPATPTGRQKRKGGPM